MLKLLTEKLKDSTKSIVPMAFLIFILSLLFLQGEYALNFTDYILYWFCILLLVVGMSLFTMGADQALMEIGNSIGSFLGKKGKILLVFICALIIGFIASVAEPDLTILAKNANNQSLIVVISLGVAFLLILASMKILFKIRTSSILIFCYMIILGLIILLSYFDKLYYLGLCFDSSGVTTGPMSVPFILAFGSGLCVLHSRKGGTDDSFGIIGIISSGPIIAILLLALFSNGGFSVSYSAPVAENLFECLGQYFGKVLITLSPIVLFFFVFNFIFLKYPKQFLFKLAIGLFYAYIGLVMFLGAIEYSFMPIANKLGVIFADKSSFVITIIGLIVGFLMAFSEPAVHVLTKQVDKLTSGTISQKTMLYSISLGVALSVGIAFLRNYLEIDILYFIVPIYILNLSLSLFNDDLFTGIAFDSGGVASGAIASGFAFPMILALCYTRIPQYLLNDNHYVSSYLLNYGYGTIALIASIPILVIQVLGAIYKIATMKKSKVSEQKEIYILEFDV